MSTIAKPERRRFTGPALRIVIAAVLIVLAAGTFAYQQFTARPVDPLQGAATVPVAPAIASPRTPRCSCSILAN
jgi:hypothetical protein